nr:MAG TPA: hypothetical protein [Caudoviricetes sp.]
MLLAFPPSIALNHLPLQKLSASNLIFIKRKLSASPSMN